MSANEPILPQGAGYGVGERTPASDAVHHVSDPSPQSSVRAILVATGDDMQIPRLYRDRAVLQRVHGLPDRHPGALHWLLAQELGGVQQRVSEREARPHRVRHRFGVDMGCDASEY